jgi:hypothetical protein
MKLIAIRDIANNKALGLKLTDERGNLLPGVKHEEQVPKGYRFELGDSDLKNSTDTDRSKILQLIGHRAAIFDVPENKGDIDRILKEVAIADKAEKASAERQKASDQVSVAAILAALPDMIAAAVQAALPSKGK